MSWANEAVFYHLYPLGALAAPERNDFASPPAHRLRELERWLDQLVDLGATALLLGPVFESSSHGYDTADYYTVDRRLGTNADLAAFSRALHDRGIRLVLDAVFNHVGRNFWAFRDVLERGWDSPYRDWFHLDFDQRSPFGDPFSYRGWREHLSLVKLNTDNSGVREHLFGAVREWSAQFGIDGLRLDAADALDHRFQRDLAAFRRGLDRDLWLLGEVIHGDYRNWANPDELDSVTNYELYKALHSSLNDHNYFELAYALNRHSGPEGRYQQLALYTFADNHDVDRVASQLADSANLYPLYALLFTIPGIPSIYYGSEWGLKGRKGGDTDAPLRPALDPLMLAGEAPAADLHAAIKRFIRLRSEHPALRHGRYRQLHVAAEQFAFLRFTEGEQIVVAANATAGQIEITLSLPDTQSGRLVDVLDGGAPIPISAGRARVTLFPNWARVFRLG